MFTWLKGLLGTNPIEAAGRAVDYLTFTDEERAKFEQAKIEAYTKYMEATQPQNVSRRVIAFAVTTLFVLLVLIICITYKIDPQYSEFLQKVLNSNVKTPFEIIVGFYFLIGVTRSLKAK